MQNFAKTVGLSCWVIYPNFELNFADISIVRGLESGLVCVETMVVRVIVLSGTIAKHRIMSKLDSSASPLLDPCPHTARRGTNTTMQLHYCLLVCKTSAPALILTLPTAVLPSWNLSIPMLDWSVGWYFVLCKLMSHDSISSYFLTLPTMQ